MFLVSDYHRQLVANDWQAIGHDLGLKCTTSCAIKKRARRADRRVDRSAELIAIRSTPSDPNKIFITKCKNRSSFYL